MQAVPHQPVIDRESCIHFKTGGCKVCEKVCEVKAVDHTQEDTIEEIEVGAVILSTGFKQFDAKGIPEYGYGKYKNVLTGLDFEKMNSASGPTGGQIMMANGQAPKSVGIIHCVGSRDERHNKYCSRVCCMYALKFAHLIKEKTGADVYNFYIDMRCFGKGYEEFYHRLLEEEVRFIRGRAASITRFPVQRSGGRKTDCPGGRHADRPGAPDPCGHGHPGKRSGAGGRRQGHRPYFQHQLRRRVPSSRKGIRSLLRYRLQPTESSSPAPARVPRIFRIRWRRPGRRPPPSSP